MMRLDGAVIWFVLLSLSAGQLAPAGADESQPTIPELQRAVRRALPLLQKGTAGSAQQRKCFTCHNQAVPLVALTAARQRGLQIDEEDFARQIEHTQAHLERGRENYLAGRGQGGKVITAGYALWALHAGERSRSETTDAVVDFFLQYQSDADHWSQSSQRPPSSGSDFTATFLAVRGLTSFAQPRHQAAIQQRLESVRRWVRQATPVDNEDRVFRIWTLRELAEDQERIQRETQELIDMQHANGGWSQTSQMESDAYATATSLVALMGPARQTAEHSSVRRGLRYLLDRQLADGSWHVVTRADGFQTYFESGFPHGEDQFISMAASAWATLALIQAMP